MSLLRLFRRGTCSNCGLSKRICECTKQRCSQCGKQGLLTWQGLIRCEDFGEKPTCHNCYIQERYSNPKRLRVELGLPYTPESMEVVEEICREELAKVGKEAL